MSRSNVFKSAMALTVLAALAACGSSQQDRAITGGALGAGAGAAAAVLAGTDPLSGAAVGGAIGAATGVLTDRDDIDLGDPIYRR